MEVGNILQNLFTNMFYVICERDEGVIRAFLINPKTRYLYRQEHVLTEEELKQSIEVNDNCKLKKIHRIVYKSLKGWVFKN